MKRTIYFQGGLGNQMFQYAFYKYLEHIGEQNLAISIASPSLKRHCGFELFRIFPKINQNKPKIVSSLLKNAYYNVVYQVRNRIEYTHPYLLFEHFNTICDAEHLKLGNARLLMGFWQNKFYCEQVKDIIFEDFTFMPFEDAENIQIAKLISEAESSVSLHIRRGDYLQNNIYGNVCTLDYYEKAISYLQNQIKNPTFFVFSDDPNWVKENLQLPNAHYIAHNKGANAFRDMQLMSLCKHNIIANSSFSWWGAWLNQYKEKIVITPSIWYNIPNNRVIDDLISDKWVRIK
jgi:hypothetical protein